MPEVWSSNSEIVTSCPQGSPGEACEVIGEAELARLDQLHDRGSSERLCHRADGVDRLSRGCHLGGDIGQSETLREVKPTALADSDRQSRHWPRPTDGRRHYPLDSTSGERPVYYLRGRTA
jgi:hypothetical protein